MLGERAPLTSFFSKLAQKAAKLARGDMSAQLARSIDERSQKRLELALAQGADPAALCPDGRRPLHCAVESGWGIGCSLLIRAGAPVDARGAYGETALARACESGDKFMSCLRALLEGGANPEARAPGGPSPVELAAASGGRGAIGILLGAGAVAGRGALASALRNKDKAMAILLIDSGADEGALTDCERLLTHDPDLGAWARARIERRCLGQTTASPSAADRRPFSI